MLLCVANVFSRLLVIDHLFSIFEYCIEFVFEVARCVIHM